jgi:hypothetical protein
VIEGRGIIRFLNKDYFDGFFKNGKFDGIGTYTSLKYRQKYEG